VRITSLVVLGVVGCASPAPRVTAPQDLTTVPPALRQQTGPAGPAAATLDGGVEAKRSALDDKLGRPASRPAPPRVVPDEWSFDEVPYDRPNGADVRRVLLRCVNRGLKRDPKRRATIRLEIDFRDRRVVKATSRAEPPWPELTGCMESAVRGLRIGNPGAVVIQMPINVDPAD
jgi:hypothetical protein